MCLVGIDMSIRSPGLAIVCDCSPTRQISLYFLCTRKRDRGRVFSTTLLDGVRFHVKPLPDLALSLTIGSNMMFYDRLCTSMTNVIKSTCTNQQKVICIEDYAFAVNNSSSMSRLHEVTGILKWMVYNEGWQIRLYSPSAIKLAFTGHGRADKNDMYQRCRELGYPCLYSVFQIPLPQITKKIVPAPISDLVDAFALTYSHIQITNPSLRKHTRQRKRKGNVNQSSKITKQKILNKS